MINKMIPKRNISICIHNCMYAGTNYKHEIMLLADHKSGDGYVYKVTHQLEDRQTNLGKTFFRFWWYDPTQSDKAFEHYYWLLETQFKNEPKGGVFMQT